MRNVTALANVAKIMNIIIGVGVSMDPMLNGIIVRLWETLQQSKVILAHFLRVSTFLRKS